MVIVKQDRRVSPEWFAAVTAERDAAARQIRQSMRAANRARKRLAALDALLAEVK